MNAYVRVAVGNERYGLAVETVREVTAADTLVDVPGAGPHVAGVRQLHGELLPVVHLSKILGADAGEPAQIVVVEDRGRRAGLAVDAAEAVEELPEPEPHEVALTRGAVLHHGRLVAIVDVPKLLDAVGESVG